MKAKKLVAGTVLFVAVGVNLGGVAFAADGDSSVVLEPVTTSSTPSTTPPATTTVAPTTTTTPPPTSSSPSAQVSVPQQRIDDLDCKDFPNQQAAQAVLDADRSDPNRLDADHDGKACESLADGLTAQGTQQIARKPVGSVDAGSQGAPRVPPLTAMAALGVLGTGSCALVTLYRRTRGQS